MNNGENHIGVISTTDQQGRRTGKKGRRVLTLFAPFSLLACQTANKCDLNLLPPTSAISTYYCPYLNLLLSKLLASLALIRSKKKERKITRSMHLLNHGASDRVHFNFVVMPHRKAGSRNHNIYNQYYD